MKNKDFAHLIRPILTLWMAFAFVLAVFLRMLDAGYLAYAFCGIIIFWFGERAFRNFATISSQIAPPAQPTTALPISPESHEPDLEKPPQNEKPAQDTIQPEQAPKIEPVKKSYWDMAPGEIEKVIINWYKNQLAEAQASVDLVSGPNYPQDVKDRHGHILYEAKKDWEQLPGHIESIKTGKSEPPALLGVLGYLLAPIPREEIPNWAKIELKNNP